MKIDGTINYGHLLTAGTIMVGLIVWGTNSANDAKQAREETAGLRADISSWRSEFTGAQKEQGAKIDNIQAQLSQKFPAYDNDIKNLTERTTRLEAVVGKQDSDMDTHDRRIWTLERFMEEVRQASKGVFSQPTPPTGPPTTRR